MKKNILVCVSGLTPQVVTETLFCLTVKEKTKIDEVYVITTKRGRDVILGQDEAPNTPKTSLKKEISNLCKMYKLKTPVFENNDSHIIIAKEESIELPDVRSDKDNILFPNRAASFFRDITSNPDVKLFCSITGGRKSMSVHIANAFSIFAREGDKLMHVLTKEENEFKGFYPVNKKEAEDLQLSDIPFVRLRSLLSNDMKGEKVFNLNFDKIVEYTQSRLKIMNDTKKLICDIEKRELSYGNNSISLEPIEFLYYFYFIDQKTKGNNKISIYNITDKDTASAFMKYIEDYYPYYYIRESQKKNWSKGLDAKDFRSKRTKINQKIYELVKDKDIALLFKIEVDKKYGNSKYFVPAEISKIKIIYPKT